MATDAATVARDRLEAELGERSLRRMQRDDTIRRIRQDEDGALAANTESDTACWYVAAVHPGHEQATEAALKAIGAEALVPMRQGKRRRRRGRMLPPRDEVLMTGYVLVRFVSTAKALRGLLRQEHVTAILGGWETPYAIPADAVEALMRKADNGAFDYDRQSDVQVVAGDRVTIEDGIFAGQVGSVVTPNTTGKGDVVIEVDLFGRLTPMVVPLASIARL